MNSKKDMTRIEDLSEYLHSDDPETEAILKETNSKINTPVAESELDEEPPSFNEFRPENSQPHLNAPAAPELPNENEILPDSSPPTSVDATPMTEMATETAPELTSEIAPEIKLDTNFDFPLPQSFPEDIAEVSSQQMPKSQIESIVEAEETMAPPPPDLPRSPKENFSEIRKFAENINLGVGTHSGHPPYSILIKNIKYKEDTEDILRILKEFKVVKNDNQTEIEKSLEMGNLLLSHLSEFAAIVIAHKIRKYDLDLELGPSDQIHPSLFYKQEKGGPVTKSNYLVNREDYHQFTAKNLTPADIIMCTAAQLENYQIIRYLGIVSEHLIVDGNFFSQYQASHEMEDLYAQLQNELKEKAIKKEGNAVVGINFQITPINKHEQRQEELSYQVSCTGNVVWALSTSLK